MLVGWEGGEIVWGKLLVMSTKDENKSGGIDVA